MDWKTNLDEAEECISTELTKLNRFKGVAWIWFGGAATKNDQRKREAKIERSIWEGW